MLVEAMGIGRQSLYNTFGDKWRLYQAALQRYNILEGHAHVAALRTPTRAVDGLRAMMERVVDEARKPCLGVGAICEFGNSKPEVGRSTRQPTGSSARPSARAFARHRPTATSRRICSPTRWSTFSLPLSRASGSPPGGADVIRLEALGRTALRALR